MSQLISSFNQIVFQLQQAGFSLGCGEESLGDKLSVSDTEDEGVIVIPRRGDNSLHRTSSETSFHVSSVSDDVSENADMAMSSQVSVDEGMQSKSQITQLAQLSPKELERFIESTDTTGLAKDGISPKVATKAEKMGAAEIKQMQIDVKKFSSDTRHVHSFVQLLVDHKMALVKHAASEEKLNQLMIEIQTAEEAAKRQIDMIQVVEDTSGRQKLFRVTLKLDGKTRVITADTADKVRKNAEEALKENALKKLPKKVLKERKNLQKLMEQQPTFESLGVSATAAEDRLDLMGSGPISAVTAAMENSEQFMTYNATLSRVTNGADVAGSALGIISYGLMMRRATSQHDRAVFLRKQAAELEASGCKAHAQLMRNAADKCQRRSAGIATLASAGLCGCLAETATGAIAIRSTLEVVSTTAVMGAGIASGAMGIALGGIGAALNIRNMVKASGKSRNVKQTIHHLLTRHALLPGTEEEVRLGLEICQMIMHKQNQKFFGEATNLDINALIVASGATAVAAAAVGGATMGIAPAAIGGVAVALALTRWYVIHKREMREEDRQGWLSESGQDLSTDQGLYVSLYFQVKSELEVQKQRLARGVTVPPPMIFCNEICPLLDLDPRAFVEVVDSLADSFKDQMNAHRHAILEALIERQEAFANGVSDPVLSRRVNELAQLGQFGGEYRPGGWKDYQSESQLQVKIEEKKAELHKIRKVVDKRTEKGKPSSETLEARRKKYETKIDQLEQRLKKLKTSHILRDSPLRPLVSS